MPNAEKFLLLGAVTLASVLIAQELDKAVTRRDAAMTGIDQAEIEPPTPAPTETPTLLSLAPSSTGFPDTLTACKGMAPSFGTNVDRDLVITDYKQLVMAEGSVRLATAPVGGGCLSSLFGLRNGRLHKGLDFYNRDAVPILAAGDGEIRRQRYHRDYGNMVVIDHGRGVFTRYAHLEGFAGAAEGDRVMAGQVLGMMGNSGNRSIPRHLHYEVLTGTWGARAGSFALTPIDVLSLPEPDG